MESPKRLKIKSIITDCKWYSDESNWGIFDFVTSDKIDHKLLDKDFFSPSKKCGQIVGQVQKLELGEEYILEVEVEYNKKYRKEQFKPIRAIKEMPTTIDQQERFLSSLLTKNQVDSLLKIYPNIVKNIIDNDNIEVSLLKGIGEKKIIDIKNKILENYILIDLLAMLSPYGITFNQIKKISTISDNPILVKEMIEKNPYILTQIKGFGFKKTDTIALKLNPELKVSEFRATEYIKYILEDISTSIGHTWIERNFIISKARKDVPQCIDIIKSIIDREKENKTFLKIIDNKIGLLINYNTEKAILRELERINNNEFSYNIPNIEQVKNIINTTEEKQGFKLSKEQNKTILSLSEEGNVMIISGSAGSGKTTAINTIYNIFDSIKNKKNKKPYIQQMALSAKAAIRMREVTGRPSSTIHRALKFNGKEFLINKDCPLESDVVILDEFSMVNIQLTLSVLKAIKSGSIIIFVFDYAQLPAIGAGSVAYDLLESMRYKTSKYIKIHRQAEASGILSDANKIRIQKTPIREYKSQITTGELKDMTYFFRKTQENINESVIKYFLSGVKKYGIDDINIVTTRKDKVLNSAEEINKKIQNILIPKEHNNYMENKFKTLDFRIGDKVIHRENDSERNIFNGEIGTVKEIDRDYIGKKMQDVLIVDYGMDFNDLGEPKGHNKIIKYSKEELSQLRLAYALTVHSFQGSENKAIIVVIDSGGYSLLDSTMLYTAITRAKERCLLVADVMSFKTCIRQNKTIIRKTYLKELLKENVDG